MLYIIELVAPVVLSYCRHLTVMFLLPAIYKCNDNNSFFVHAFTGIVLHTMPRGQRFQGVCAPVSNGGNKV